MEQLGLFDMTAEDGAVHRDLTVQHDLHHDSPHWTGLAHDPQFERYDTPRPGMTHAQIPGQMDTSGNTVRSHGDVFTPHSPVSPGKYGPQMNPKAAPMWHDYSERRTIRNDTPVHTGQAGLRYNPSSPTVKDMIGGHHVEVTPSPVQIRGPITAAGSTEDRDPHITSVFGGGTDNGLPKVVKKNNTLYRADGHHRAFESRNRGNETSDVDLLDLDKHPEAEKHLTSSNNKMGTTTYQGLQGALGPVNRNVNGAQFNTSAVGHYKSYEGPTQHGRKNIYGQELDTYHEVRNPKPPLTYNPRTSRARNDDSDVHIAYQ